MSGSPFAAVALAVSLAAISVVPASGQVYAPGFEPTSLEEAQIREYLDQAREWSRAMFTMRQIQPFERARERYLVVGALLHAVEAPNHQIEYWTVQLIGRDVAPHEPFRLRLRDMDLFPRIAVLDLNGDGLQDVLICEDRDKRPNPWSITFDRGWRVLNEDVGERPECS